MSRGSIMAIAKFRNAKAASDPTYTLNEQPDLKSPEREEEKKFTYRPVSSTAVKTCTRLT